MASAADIAAYKQFAGEMADTYGIPRDLFLWQIGSESSWNPTAKNPNSSAYGIAQFTKGTAEWRGVDPTDPYDSIQGAASYMAYLKEKTGSWQKALWSYGTTHNNPAKAAEAAAILAGQPDGTLYSTAPGIEIWIPEDAGIGGTGSDQKIYEDGSGSAPTTQPPGFVDSSIGNFFRKYLGGIALAVLGVAFLVLAFFAWKEDK